MVYQPPNRTSKNVESFYRGISDLEKSLAPKTKEKTYRMKFCWQIYLFGFRMRIQTLDVIDVIRNEHNIRYKRRFPIPSSAFVGSFLFQYRIVFFSDPSVRHPAGHASRWSKGSTSSSASSTTSGRQLASQQQRQWILERTPRTTGHRLQRWRSHEVNVIPFTIRAFYSIFLFSTKHFLHRIKIIFIVFRKYFLVEASADLIFHGQNINVTIIIIFHTANFYC